PLAILLLFRKESETDTDVIYRFGGADPPFARALTISKADYAVTVEDGRMDRMAIFVAGTAISRHRQDGTWIEAG
ncbi:hypothetical protein, partial [Nocardia thailandica]|uniref:hypothetical protein n=1 Tax=Nocardia thailandica TaxID=257275 RepID=UPI0005BE47E9